MSGQDEQENTRKPWDDEVLTDAAVELVVGFMRSADTDIIRPVDWWPRAKTALIVSAAVAETYPAMVSKFLGKIQVPAPRKETTQVIAAVGAQLTEWGPDAWERFRFLCERDALYIVAMAQVMNQQRKEKQ